MAQTDGARSWHVSAHIVLTGPHDLAGVKINKVPSNRDFDPDLIKAIRRLLQHASLGGKAKVSRSSKQA